MTSAASPAPFTASDFAARMAHAAAQAAEQGYDGLLVAPGPDLFYLTSYQPIALTERLTLLALQPDQDPTLIVPILERPDAARAVEGAGITILDWRDGDDPYTQISSVLNSRGKYAISDVTWALQVLGLQAVNPELQLTSMTRALPMLRAAKDAREVERLAAAGAAADQCFEALLHVQFSGRKETDVAGDLAQLLLDHGHSQVDFTVVGSGPNGANPHHEAGDRVIQQGDMVVLDFGGLKDGYGSDTSRTVHVGELTSEEQEVHDIVRRAQQAGYEAVRPGNTCQDVDRAARGVITDAGYGDWFLHRTGHGIGMTTHEPPYMQEGEEHPLVPGMCFSIEPGIYVPDRFGVRIEDIVTVTEDGGRRLNNTTREVQLVS